MAVRDILRQSIVFDRSHLEPLAALRCTVGVAIPLAAGLVAGQPWIGAFGAIGAVSVGYGSFQGAYRSRAAVMVFASIGMAVALFLGTVSAGKIVPATALATITAFLAGYFVALGPAASFVALQSGIAVIIAEGFPASARVAALRAAVVLAGGLAQTLLVVSVWPLRRFSAERASTAAVYASVAAYARRLAQGDLTAPEPHTLAATMAPVADPHPLAHAGYVLVFQALHDEAERIRASLAGLAVRRQPIAAAAAACTSSLSAAIGDVLGEIANALSEGREPRDGRHTWKAIETCASQFPATPAVDALLGQLRAAWRVAGSPAADSNVTPEATPRALRPRPPISDALTTLKANLTLSSSAFRHAIRLAVAVAIATTVYFAFHLGRGYWIPMTALIVLRPDFYETFVRGLARIAGTLVGAAIATAIVDLFHPSPTALAVLLLVCVWGCYSLFRVNYAVFAICLTGYVVFVLMLSGVAELTAATTRAMYTIEGGALAIAIYAIWPTWAGRSARASFAAMLDAQGAYVDALLSPFVDPASLDLARLTRLRSDARLQRSNTEALIERMNVEPAARASIDRRRALALLAALRRHALAALAIHAGLENGQAHAVPGTAELLAHMRVAFARLADAVRGSHPPDPMPPLRQQHSAVAHDPSIGVETDLMVDSLNTMAELLAQRATDRSPSDAIRVSAPESDRSGSHAARE
jgi:uncharacterized membrane protein YccC